MPDENKHPRKSIIKSPSISFEPKGENRLTQLDPPRKSSGGDSTRIGGYFQLAVPQFFGGAKKHSDSSYTHSRGTSLGSVGAYQASSNLNLRSSQRVRFLDRLSVRSISSINIGFSSNANFNDGDNVRHQQLRDIQDDPSYLPGFVDLYYATEITISEDTCCCSFHTSYKIINDTSGKVIYGAEKEINGVFSPCLKFFCLRRYDLMRIGFTIRVFNTAINNTKLLTFKRKTHWSANQLDIVETYYSLENAPVGRIDKTKDGFRLIDSRGAEKYRVLRESKREEKMFTSVGTLVVFCCETRKIVSKITYVKRKFMGALFSLFMGSLKHTIRWSPEIGVSMKTLLLGVLFLELHSIEKYVDLPIGRDANPTMNSTKHRLNSKV